MAKPTMGTGLFLMENSDTRDAQLFDWSLKSLEDDSLSAYDYLHGFCTVFALCLNNLFGYEIDWLIEDDFQECNYEAHPYSFLAHMYCVHHRFYLDVRGATVDSRNFFEEFEDFFDYPGLAIDCPDTEEIKFLIIQDLGEEMYNKLYEEAEKYIIAHKEWYNFHK